MSNNWLRQITNVYNDNFIAVKLSNELDDINDSYVKIVKYLEPLSHSLIDSFFFSEYSNEDYNLTFEKYLVNIINRLVHQDVRTHFIVLKGFDFWCKNKTKNEFKENIALDNWDGVLNPMILNIFHKKRKTNWVYNLLYWLKYAIIPHLKRNYDFDLFVVGIYQNYFKNVLFYKDIFRFTEITVPPKWASSNKNFDFSSKLFLKNHYPFRVIHSEIALRRTTLIVGDPGSGKTTLIRALESSWLNFVDENSQNGLVFPMDLCKMVTPYVGEGETYIRELFGKTRYLNTNALITIDGVELFAAAEHLESSEERTSIYKNIFHSLMEQIRNMSKNTKLIAVSNVPINKINPSFLNLMETVINCGPRYGR